MTINDVMTALCDELATETLVPLRQALTLALVWLDLCRLAGEEPPTNVLALAETPIAAYGPYSSRWAEPTRASSPRTRP